jgi:alginate O-acetyltransferase complex protein AlgI
MVFSTYLFIFYFLPLVLLVYWTLPLLAARFGASEEFVSRGRNIWLLVMSYAFYGWWNPWYVLLMFGVTAANYGCGVFMSRAGASDRERLLGVTAAIVISLSTLGFFKYFMLFQTSANHLLGWLGGQPMPVLKVLLPMGISFYVFHALSYSIDLYRRDAPPARSLPDFACYIALFPQLVAGPIIRYNSVADQFLRRTHTNEKFASGVALFVLGLGKKVLLANPVGQIANAAFGAASLTALDAWWGVIAYAFQIYFDFSGYSDMAVGLGRMIGFEFMKNFDAPYQSESITEFWRRWHISLSTFLRDYLYIPLGGNRKGPRRTYLNLTIVMLLGGLWHGASWTFVVWGAYHGVLLAFERWLGKRSLYHRLPRPVRVLVTFVLVLFAWVLFRSESFEEAWQYLGTMFGHGPSGPGAVLLAAELYGRGQFLLMALCAFLTFTPWQAHEWSGSLTWPKGLAVAPAFCLALVTMFAQAFNPFLYFRF